MKTNNLLTMVLCAILFASCQNDSISPNNLPGLYENGYFVTNEGNFGTGNGSISYVSENGNVENNIFSQINSFQLGDVVQSMNIINEKGYIIVNATNKIEVVSADSLKHIKTINNIGFPRYITKVTDNKAYISTWGIGSGNKVEILDLNSDEIIGSINCGKGPEAIVVSNGYAYVCNVGGYEKDNTISVIDIYSDQVISTITVNDKPNSAVIDLNNNLWIICGGEIDYSNWPNLTSLSTASILMLNNNSIEKSFELSATDSPKNLTFENNTLYYTTNSGIFILNVNDSELPTTALINKNFYGLAVKNNYIYATYSPDFEQNGWSYRYNLNGLLLDSVEVGVGPNGYLFN